MGPYNLLIDWNNDHKNNRMAGMVNGGSDFTNVYGDEEHVDIYQVE